MKVGIVDADLIGRDKHRFPNLVSMKLSGYHKSLGDTVELIRSYNKLYMGGGFDKIYLSKVFTDTEVPEWVLKLNNIEFGGTGFFYDKAPNLPYHIEHFIPDYTLYDEYVDDEIRRGIKPVNFKMYKDYSIGFTTRGCFRKCEFCVNKKYNKAFLHSPLDEFVDPDRKKICLLDDNFFGCPNWKEILLQLRNTGKPFRFHQGLDERILTEEKAKLLFSSKYDGDFIFAFDNIKDAELIESKLQLIRKITDKKNIKFYCFCAFNHLAPDTYSDDFWVKDIEDLFKRIQILFKYSCYPYVMRYKDWEESPLRGMYIAISGWCNQPSMVKKCTLREFAQLKLKDGNRAVLRYIVDFEKKYPDVAREYFDMRITPI